MLGLASFGYHAYADRFTYIPSFGLALLLAHFLKCAATRFGSAAAFLPMAAVIAALSSATWWQTGFWKDDLTLFSRTVEVDGDGNSAAHRILAMYYFEIPHDLEKMRYHCEKSLAANRETLAGEMYLYVQALVELGRDEEARSVLRDFEDDIVRHYGEERAFEIMRRTPEPSMKEAQIALSHALARVALMLGKDRNLSEARQVLEGMRVWMEDRAPWQYFMWRCHALAEEKKEADAMLARLHDPSGRKEYVQCRFMRSRMR